MKHIIYSFLCIAISCTTTYGQTSSVENSTSSNTMTFFYFTIGFMFVILLIVLAVMIHMLSVLNALIQHTRQAHPQAEAEHKTRISFWARLWESLNRRASVEQEPAIARKHSFDGIVELDNHLPPWWNGLLYVTVIFSVVYMIIYHVTDSLPLSDQEYTNEVSYAAKMIEQASSNSSASFVAIDETTVAVSTDDQVLSEGKKIFLNTCASCHRVDGGGDIGPNLTDDYWKSGGSIQSIFKVIKAGVPNTNMIAWEGVISPQNMSDVANYILTMRGSNPENPKAPEGELYVPE